MAQAQLGCAQSRPAPRPAVWGCESDDEGCHRSAQHPSMHACVHKNGVHEEACRWHCYTRQSACLPGRDACGTKAARHDTVHRSLTSVSSRRQPTCPHAGQAPHPLAAHQSGLSLVHCMASSNARSCRPRCRQQAARRSSASQQPPGLSFTSSPSTRSAASQSPRRIARVARPRRSPEAAGSAAVLASLHSAACAGGARCS